MSFIRIFSVLVKNNNKRYPRYFKGVYYCNLIQLRNKNKERKKETKGHFNKWNFLETADAHIWWHFHNKILTNRSVLILIPRSDILTYLFSIHLCHQLEHILLQTSPKYGYCITLHADAISSNTSRALLRLSRRSCWMLPNWGKTERRSERVYPHTCLFGCHLTTRVDNGSCNLLFRLSCLNNLKEKRVNSTIHKRHVCTVRI